ncbi:protein kinase [Pseudenhygromyxa sp. WMMC2535]|uniref:serine/threonine protein kinase n=1 Tax=Pseudenhygromyxa sp. WMMC2535 TaxID=2712867 RepID=UPI0015540A99|nr:serine/threonine-protein kinase [Pseudenhygromyxa sp. WMMC2535]NVB38760.1 protein kinase [Pseudenhygromyxa sp. WMMC2535]
MDRLTEEYRLARRIGRGGMGEVWEALRVKDSGVVVPCAIKLLHADFTETARERRMFLAEAVIATQLDHGRIVKVTDLDTASDGRPFLVMERVDGVNLRSFLAAARQRAVVRLDLDLVTYIIGEVLFALDYAHGRVVGDSDAGVIHSDVTPGNILLSSCGEVKLTDFGIARFAATAGPMSRAIGTPRYMSPEQLGGDPQRATDIYGLGVVLHELLEGERFLDGLTPDRFRSRVLMGPPPALKRDDVPAWLDELRQRMIATDPRERPSASEAREVLVEHCPRYLAAAVQLQREYARLVGRARSGMTQQLSEGAAGVASVPAATPEAPTPEVSTPEEQEDEDEIPPTELLPATSAPEPDSAPALTPGSVPSKPRESLRWLAIPTGLAALGICFVGLSLLVQALREPAPVSASADPAALPDPAQLRQPEPGPQPKPEQEPPAPEPPPDPAPEPDPAQLQPADSPSPSTVAASDPTDPSASEPEVQHEEASEPPPKTKTKARPKAKTKIGVMFLIETNVEGKLKWGSKIIPVKNRSAYAELPTGSHRLSWLPEGSDDWQAHGRLSIEDIGPMRYKVRLQDGKITEISEIPA